MENKYSIFARNLDDGELCLLPDVFFKDVPSRFKPHLHLHHHHHHLPFSHMDDLAQHLAALSLRKHLQKPPRATNFEMLKEPVRYDSMNGAGLVDNLSLYGLRTGPFLGGTKSVYEVQFLKPNQAQVESYIEARARALQRQQNRLVQNRVLPFQANGFSNSKKLVRESGGTGVFHPRIVNTNPNGTTYDSKKKQNMGFRNREISVHNQEIEVSSGKINSMKRVVNVGKQQEDCYYNLPPEMDLPRDWTY